MSPTEELGAKNSPIGKYKPHLESSGSDEFRVIKVNPPALPPVLSLDPSDADLLRDLAGRLTVEPDKEPDRFCEVAALLAADLPRGLRRQLGIFSRYGTREGYLVVRGLPVDARLPDTPLSNEQHLGESTLAARVQAILNQGLGEMVAFEAEGHGRLFQDMVPSRQATNTQTSLSSGVELELHTEQAFSPLKPDWVSLYCLRGNSGAATYALSARALVAALSPAERELLRKPLWTTQVDESFRVGGDGFLAGELRGPLPVLEGSQDDPFIRFDQDLDWGVSEQAEALRRKIIELYPQLRASHTLAPGEMLLVDNLRVVHGRSPFKARFDGTDRFIVRSFLVRDLAKSRHARPGNGRTISAQFS